MVRNGKEPETLEISWWLQLSKRQLLTFFAESLIRNAEARSSTLLCSTIYFQPLQPPATVAVLANWPIRGQLIV